VTSPVQKDRVFFETGVQELVDYLLSDELYWTITNRNVSLPRLTIGGLLLARACLQAWEELAGLSPVEDRMESIRAKWRAAWEKKAASELHARFDLWRNYLSDYRRAPEEQAEAYPQEVRWRVILQLLLDELATPPPEQDSLSQLDRSLQAAFVPGKFIWESRLVSTFPRGKFWFLYGSLKV
jgi:hypothetical protein